MGWVGQSVTVCALRGLRAGDLFLWRQSCEGSAAGHLKGRLTARARGIRAGCCSMPTF